MRSSVSWMFSLALTAVTLASVAIASPGCGGGCEISAENPDISGQWEGGCGSTTTCTIVDDNGTITANCPGFASCNGSMCSSSISLECTSALDGSSFSGDVKVSSDAKTLTGTLDGTDGQQCNLIFERHGGHDGPG